MLDLLRVKGNDASAVLLDAPVHDLEWFDQAIEWQLLSLDHQQEEIRTGVKGLSL